MAVQGAKRNRASRSRSNLNGEIKKRRGRGRWGLTMADRVVPDEAARVASNGGGGDSPPGPVAVTLTVPTHLMAPAPQADDTQVPMASGRTVEFSGGAPLSGGATKPRPRPKGAPALRMTLNTDSPPRSLEQRLKGLPPLVQKQWIDRIEAERVSEAAKVKAVAQVGAGGGGGSSGPARQ